MKQWKNAVSRIRDFAGYKSPPVCKSKKRFMMKMMFDEPLSLMLMQKTDDMSGAGDLRDNMATLSEMNLDDFASAEDVTVTF